MENDANMPSGGGLQDQVGFILSSSKMNLWLIQTIRREKVGRSPKDRMIKKETEKGKTKCKSLSIHNTILDG